MGNLNTEFCLYNNHVGLIPLLQMEKLKTRQFN